MDNTFRFNLTVSDKAFKEKLPNKDPRYARITMTQHNVSLEEFGELILQGHIFSAVYKQQHITQTQRNKKNFVYANAIAIDIDDSDCSLDDYLQTLPYTPTIAYETFSNMQCGCGYRYRFIYVFDENINADGYCAMYNAVCDANGISNASANDKCMKSPVQMFWGTSANAVLYNFGNVYSTSDFRDYMVEDSGLTNLIYYNYTTLTNKESQTRISFKDNEFKKLWQGSGTDMEILIKMRHYHTYECTKIDWQDGELWRDLDDEYYYEIKRKWENRLSINGGRYKNIPISKRLKNGEHRRSMIWTSLVRRRLIDPTIMMEHLCYAALYELTYFIDNTDKKDIITRADLLVKAEEALRTDLDKYREGMRSSMTCQRM